MSFCPIDEAFGNYLTNDLNPNPLESSIYQNMDGRNCQKKQKAKKKSINCNRKKTSYTMNPQDIYVSSPDVSEDDEQFNNTLQNYNPQSHMDLYNINAANPIKKCKKKKRKPAYDSTLDNLSNSYHADSYTRPVQDSNCIVEGFDNYNTVQPERVFKVKKSRKNTRVKRPEVNEIYEYNEDENKSLDTLGYVHEETDSEVEETKPILRYDSNTQKKQKQPENQSSKPKGELNNQITEINNKINFIMNQISTKDQEENNTYNNINDIILFVIFGVFVLIVIEGLYRLISKVIKANSIIDSSKSSLPVLRPNTVSGKSNKVGGSITSRDPLEMFRDYLQSNQSS